MPQSSAEKIALEAIWESHKTTIMRLYISEDNSLGQLMEVMKNSHQFDASKSQYERYFKKWGLRKNLKGQEWKAVSHQLGKRKRAGKESELYVDGVLVPMNKVQKETSRNDFRPVWERYVPAPSPELPAGVLVCTPTPSNVDAFITENIPWFQYRSMLASHVNQLWIPSLSTAFRPDLGQIGTNLQMTSNFLVAFRSVMEILNSKTQSGITTREPWDLNSYIVAEMPDDHAGGHEFFLQTLIGPYDQDDMMQCLVFMIYFASNNLEFPTEDAAHIITQWLFLQDNLKILRHLLSIEGPTTEAFAESLFGFAIEAEDMMLIEIMLHTGVNANSSRTRSFLTPLKHASKIGNIQLTRLLLGAGAEVDTAPSTTPWKDSMTPLMLAVNTQRTDLVDLLVAEGARVNMKDWDGNSALHIAAKHGNVELVQILISAGADVNCTNKRGETTLHEAVKGHEIETVKVLLRAGADVNATVLMSVVEMGSTDLVVCMLDAGPQHMGSAIFSAASQSEMEIVQILVNAGADFDYPSNEGLTALTAAIIVKDTELATFLLREGANVNGWPTDSDFTLITPLQAASLRDMTELAQILLEAGADMNSPTICRLPYENFSHFADFSDSDGDDRDFKFIGTALQIAVHRQNQELAEILLEAGANVNAAASEVHGRTALQAAVMRGSNPLVHWLLDAGANVNAAASEVHGRTALQTAVENGDNYLIKCLLDAGADINGLPGKNRGVTVLTAAVKRGAFDLIPLC